MALSSSVGDSSTRSSHALETGDNGDDLAAATHSGVHVQQSEAAHRCGVGSRPQMESAAVGRGGEEDGFKYARAARSVTVIGGVRCLLRASGWGSQFGEEAHQRSLQSNRRQRSICKTSIVLLTLAAAGAWLPGTAALSDVCGNGRVVEAAGETCDDGNLISSDGCSSTCESECGFLCSSIWGTVPGAGALQYGFFNSSCIAEYGDGKRRMDEECDDGNMETNDGCACSPATQEFAGGCFVEPRWECREVAEAEINCASRVPMGDMCKCITRSGTVTHPAQPLKEQPARVETVMSGYAGASSYVKCASCTCDHYGTCDTGGYCNWESTCSGNGFCDGGGECICFGNFTGDNCNRCKCNHYGSKCQTYCEASTTCGGHGVCDFNGACLSSPMCEGIDLHSHVCGDGLRLGVEECDDGNNASGDGCSSECKVEAGYRCLGGCSHTGDVKVRYGECRRDSCVALPCGFHLTDLSQNYSQGALFVRTPAFVKKTIIQGTPISRTDNILRITLQANVPIPRCIRSTMTVDEPLENRPWQMQKVELTRLCQRTRITISGLTGVLNTEKAPGEELDPIVLDPAMIRLRTMAGSLAQTQAFDYFGVCTGYSAERTALGYCDEVSTGASEQTVGAGIWHHKQSATAYGGESSISFTVLRDIPVDTPLAFVVTVRNGQYRNAPPKIRVEMSGIKIASSLMTPLTREFEGTSTQPLEIYGNSPPSSDGIRRVEEEGAVEAVDGGHMLQRHAGIVNSGGASTSSSSARYVVCSNYFCSVVH